MMTRQRILAVLVLLLNLLQRKSRAEESNDPGTDGRNQTTVVHNITHVLNNLLHEYDNSLRPDIGGVPTSVEVNMQVRSMGPISEVDMSYSMDCYFRQSWMDKRLAFPGTKNLALSIEMLRKIWKPDTYIYNGRKSYLHTITTPNKFVRLFPNGRVLYSQRLTIKASCMMDLSDFPMDKQRCPLQMGSFGYNDNDVKYRWTVGRGVNIASDMKLSQFDLIQTPTGNSTFILNKGRHSTLLVSFHLQRHMGNFVIQVYGPCILLVVISWVSFWLNREATSDRISLGVTTVLTMTFLGLEARTDLPQVSYPTALDYFVFISFMFIFSTVVQFALVHYFTKVGAGEYYLEELEETICHLENKRKQEREKENSEQSNGTSTDEEISLIRNHLTHLQFTNHNRFNNLDHHHRCQSHHLSLNVISSGEHYRDYTSADGDTLSPSSIEYGQLLPPVPPPVPPPPTQQQVNCLNHHPYATFYYNKKTGRSGTKRRPPPPNHNSLSSNNIVHQTANNGFNGLKRRGFFSSLGAEAASQESTPPALKDEDICQCKRCITRAMNNPEKALNSVSKIDKISRIVFPLAFLLLNMFYWYSYLKHSERIDLSFES